MNKLLRLILIKLSNNLPKVLSRIIRRILTNEHRKSIANKSVEQVFQYIYQKNIWTARNTKSGGGSTLKNTDQIRKRLPDLLRKYNVTELLDVPCGDFNWMQHTLLDGIKYTGGDIVKELIEKNIRMHHHEGHTFVQLDILKDNLPDADLLICRDCFVHLSNSDVLMSIKNLRSSNIKYLLVTSFPKTIVNDEIITGEWRKINMEIAPFNLTAIEVINEGLMEKPDKLSDKSLILVEL